MKKHLYYDVIEDIAGEKSYLLNAEMVQLLMEVSDNIEMLTIPILEGSKVTVRTPAQQKLWEQLQRKMKLRLEKRKTPSKHFTMNFHDQLVQLARALTIQEAGVLLTLSLYMELGSHGVLKINGEYMTKQDIDDILGMTNTASKKILDSLKSTCVLDYKRQKIKVFITRGKNKGKMKTITANVYSINPSIIKMGSLANKLKGFTKLYKEAGKLHFDFLSIEARGLLFKLLHFVHFQSYHLSVLPNNDLRIDETKTYFENIQNKESEKIMLQKSMNLNTDNLVEITGKTKRTINRYIREWEYARIVIRNGRGRKASFIMNPLLFTRQEEYCPYAISLMHIFKQLEPTKAPKGIKQI